MSEKHRQLFESQLPQMQAAYQHAIAAGMIDPAILILDVRDEGARKIAVAQAGDDEIMAVLEECNWQGWAAIAVLPVSAADVLSGFSTTLAGCERFFKTELRPGHVRFGILSDGAVSWGTCAIKPGNEPPLGSQPPN
ncbi:MAG TPA: hypothetical protein VHV55_19055 [Pirellulales bacterium]|jgi:hypothetical protein|nr:hypothetical protein [Pirellulales bacterium]